MIIKKMLSNFQEHLPSQESKSVIESFWIKTTFSKSKAIFASPISKYKSPKYDAMCCLPKISQKLEKKFEKT